MPKRKQQAVVLGLAENGHGLVRSLTRAGVSVTGVYSNPRDFGRFSRLCRSVVLDFDALDEQRICEEMIRLAGEGTEKPVLFASSDYQVHFLVKHQDQLAPFFRFHWTSSAELSQITDKYKMAQVCAALGIPVSRTHWPQPGEDLPRLAREFVYPCLIKPVRSFSLQLPKQLRGLVVNSPEELLDFYSANPGVESSTIWQEIVEGGDDCVYQCNVLVRSNGQLGAYLCVHKIHQYPPGFGSMSFGRSEENATILGESDRLLTHLKYRGLGSLEFKFRKKDGRYYFIEMNPRMPWYNSLIADAGINLPYLAYLDLVGEPDMRWPAAKPRTVHWASFEMELRWFLESRQARKVSLWNWLGGLTSARSFAWWEWRDPLPFLRSCVHLLGLAFGKLWRRGEKR